MNSKNRTQMIVGMGLLTAIVVVLQTLAKSIPFGMFAINLSLVPIIVGAALYGVWAGAWLGFIFSVVVLVTDAAAFLAVNIPGTIITVLAKGICAGIVAGLVYKALAKHSRFAAALVAGIVAPITNTGIFIIGCRIFFMDIINEWAATAGYDSAGKYLIGFMVGTNFAIELIINLALSATIVQIINIALKNGVAAKDSKR